MRKIKSILLNFIFFLQILLIFLLFIESRIELPVWLQVIGRLHPAILHLPIGLLAFFVILLFAKNEFKKKAFTKVTSIVLLLTSFTTSITALFGFFLSRQGDYGADALSQHKIGGTILSILCYVLVLVFDRYEKAQTVFFGLSVLAIGSLLFVGHTGGTLTHGENYVFAPLKNSSRDIPADASVFQKSIFPILEKKCISCHNETKAKGKLIMTSIAKFKKGGKKGVEWEVGKPEQSRMIKYIHLPLEDDNHMPPDGKPQLTKQEIDLLESWIKSGADFEIKLADLKENDSLKILASAMSTVSGEIETKVYGFSAVPEEIITRLNTPFRSVFPLYQNSPAVQADFFIKESYEVKALEELKEVQEQLVVLNLSKMPVTDRDLSIIGSFKNLEKLNLNFSTIKGTGLSSLQSLKNLSSLSLAGTEVTSESINTILDLPVLKELFIWNTRITEQEKEKLIVDHPDILIVTSQFKDENTLRLSLPVLTNEGILKKSEMVILKHSMPGVIIRYTLDGTKPDSISSTMYEAPFNLDITFKIKAIACKPGWYCSDVFETTCFIEGLKPNHAKLISPSDKQYPGEGANSLIDGRKGFTDVLKEPSWLGFRDNSFVAEFDFGIAPQTIRKIVVSYAHNVGSYVFPPTEVEVWASQSKQPLKLIKSFKPEEPKNYSPQRIEALNISLETGVPYSVYKIVAKPINKLPKWHSGKGKKGWFIVDEVFFY